MFSPVVFFVEMKSMSLENVSLIWISFSLS